MERTIESEAPRTGLVERMRYLAWPPREPELAGAGRAGEIVVARARLVVVLLLLLPNLATLLRDPSAPSGWLGIGTVAVCLVIAVEILRRAASETGSKPLPVIATLMDICLVSGYHVLLFLAGESSMVLESRVTFALYVIAIIGSALRYDGRLVRIAGLMAVVQYLAIVAWAGATMRATAASARFYGETTLIGQPRKCPFCWSPQCSAALSSSVHASCVSPAFATR